jgi:hypothetical protein
MENKCVIKKNEDIGPLQNFCFRIKLSQLNKITDISNKSGHDTAKVVRMLLDYALSNVEIKESE